MAAASGICGTMVRFEHNKGPLSECQSPDEDERHTTSLSIVDGWRDVQGWLCRSEQAHENKRERH